MDVKDALKLTDIHPIEEKELPKPKVEPMADIKVVKKKRVISEKGRKNMSKGGQRSAATRKMKERGASDRVKEEIAEKVVKKLQMTAAEEMEKRRQIEAQVREENKVKVQVREENKVKAQVREETPLERRKRMRNELLNKKF